MLDEIDLQEPKSQDFQPDILRVNITPSSCSKGGCKNRGATLEFIVRFLVRRIKIREHWAEFGLQGGCLALDLGGLIANEIAPESLIAPVVRGEIKNESSKQKKVNTKGPSVSGEKIRSESFESTFHQIKPGGIPSKPYWIFQQPRQGLPLEGRSEDARLRISSQEEVSCGCKYEFITTRSDWCFNVVPSLHIPVLRRYFVRLAIISFCKKYVDHYFTEKLSCGQWKCPIRAR